MNKRKKVIVIGGGFSGIQLTEKLDESLFDILLIDKLNHHQFQPLFYQVATSQIEPSSISFPLRNIFKKKNNVQIRLAEVLSVDRGNNKISTDAIKKEDKKVLDVAMRNVQFTTGTATLTKASYKNLNDVINVLKKYPEMMLNIEGHTDDVGEDVNNQKLSERRANACMNYITSKGIVASRLMASGYGESKPIGDNKTSEGRKSNRRTEFNPVWR